MSNAEILKQLNDKIEEQTQQTDDDLVFVLELDGIHFKRFTPEISQRLSRYTSLQVLNLIDCGLESLQNFPRVPSLIRLELINNQISGRDLQYLRHIRHIQSLILSHNNIDKIEDLEQLNHMKDLQVLDLFGNPVVDEAEYRKKTFQILRGLKILDQEDKEGNYEQANMSDLVQRIPSNIIEKKKVSQAQQQIIRRVSQQQVVVKKAKVQRPIKQPVQHNATHTTATVQRQQPAARGKAPSKGAFTKVRSTSARSGLVFPCGRIGRYLKKAYPNLRMSAGTKVYLAAVLEYLAAEVLELAGNAAKDNKKSRIIPNHIRNTLRMDPEFSKFFGDAILTEAGGVSTNFQLPVLKKKQQD